VDVDKDWLAAVFEQLGPHLDERQRPLLALIPGAKRAR
jgi:hypothetical protein